MSILSALKAKGAKGKNIEEAVKTLPIGGGSGGGVLVVNTTTEGQTTTLDKTWHEIDTAYKGGFNVIIVVDKSLDDPTYGYNMFCFSSVIATTFDIPFEEDNPYYGVLCIDYESGMTIEFSTTSEDGYPSRTID